MKKYKKATPAKKRKNPMAKHDAPPPGNTTSKRGGGECDMTIIEKKTIESITKNLPQLLAEQKRANELSALRIRIAIETHFSAMYREQDRYYKTLEQIMEGI